MEILVLHPDKNYDESTPYYVRVKDMSDTAKEVTYVHHVLKKITAQTLLAIGQEYTKVMLDGYNQQDVEQVMSEMDPLRRGRFVSPVWTDLQKEPNNIAYVEEEVWI